MQVYLVGGAVRDALLGYGSGDRDWVVVGSTPQAMLDQGFVAVGRDFPVFLHPQTREEYALARTERKTAPGYHGFAVHAAPGVTLEDDLARRDLTINAMAVPQTHSNAIAPDQLIDPFNGLQDLRNGVLRHVTGAFAEDPVRILRLARFAARWPAFTVAPETLDLMREMVAAGEVDHLVPERVWQEVSRGLMEAQPSRLFEVLRDCGALARLLPELDRLWGVPQRADYHPEVDTGVHAMMVLDMAAQLNTPLSVRFACLGHDLGKGTTPADVLPRHLGHEGRSAKLVAALAQRWRVPRDCAELADVVAIEHGNIHRSLDLAPAATLRLLQRCDALRRPDRFAEVLLACECDARGRLGLHNSPYPQARRLQQALQAAMAIDAGAVAQAAAAQGAKGQHIARAVDSERERAIAACTP